MNALRSFTILVRRLSLPEFTARPLRTLLAIIGIAAGVALIAGIHLVNREVVEHFRQSILSVSGPVKLQVTASGGEQPVDPDLAADVGSLPGVFAAMPVIDIEVPQYSGEHKLRIFATDLTSVRNRDAYSFTVEGVDNPTELLSDPRAILVVR